VRSLRGAHDSPLHQPVSQVRILKSDTEPDTARGHQPVLDARLMRELSVARRYPRNSCRDHPYVVRKRTDDIGVLVGCREP
jgi:hypothetical protein